MIAISIYNSINLWRILSFTGKKNRCIILSELLLFHWMLQYNFSILVLIIICDCFGVIPLSLLVTSIRKEQLINLGFQRNQSVRDEGAGQSSVGSMGRSWLQMLGENNHTNTQTQASEMTYMKGRALLRARFNNIQKTLKKKHLKKART